MSSFSPLRWRKAHETEKFVPESFLRKQEKYCVAACARFRTLNFAEDHAWMLWSAAQQTAAMLLHSRRTVFPVFNGIPALNLNIPAHLYRALSNIRIHAIHGVTRDVEMLLDILKSTGFSPEEFMDYYLMGLDSASDLREFKTLPKGLTLRRPKIDDAENMLPLQAGYEQEEVLPPCGLLDAKACRLSVFNIITKERALIAEIDGKIVGKINTNAEGYTRCQIGGVYVLPEYRGAGIASAMMAAFVRLLLAQGIGITLFVRKQNDAAVRAYLRSGFVNIADYSIVYS